MKTKPKYKLVPYVEIQVMKVEMPLDIMSKRIMAQAIRHIADEIELQPFPFEKGIMVTDEKGRAIAGARIRNKRMLR